MSRAERRRQNARALRYARRIVGDSALARKLRDNMKACDRCCCQNPRLTPSEFTRQERLAEIGEREQVDG